VHHHGAHNGVDLAVTQVKVHIVERPDTGEALARTADAQQRSAGQAETGTPVADHIRLLRFTPTDMPACASRTTALARLQTGQDSATEPLDVKRGFRHEPIR